MKTISRITYTKPNQSGLKFSKELFKLTDGTNVFVAINTNDYSFQIAKSVDDIKTTENVAVKLEDVVVHEGKTRSNQMVLRLAKKALIDLGAKIVPEVRNKKGEKKVEKVEDNQ